MNVIHGIWLPKEIQDVMQSGDFYLWVESDEAQSTASIMLYPQHLQEKRCLDFLQNDLAFGSLATRQVIAVSVVIFCFGITLVNR